MSEAKFHHFGVPSAVKHENEIYIEAIKLNLTDPVAHPYRIEFLRFDADSDFHNAVQTRPHVAFMVDDLDEAIKGKNVIIEPFDANDKLRVAFFTEDEAVIELMQEI